jgi:hypothetical protein
MAATSSPLVNYENSTFGMRISYPWNWTKYESHDGSSPLIVQFTDKPAVSSYEEIPSLGVLNITGRPVTLNASTNDMSIYLQEWLNDSMTTLPAFNLIETRNTTINAHQQNIPATMTLYSYQDPLHNEVYVLTVDILKDGRFYSLEYSADPETYFKNSQILMNMVDSFEITQAPNTTMVVPPSTNFKSYKNSDPGISIEYPDNWIYEEGEAHVELELAAVELVELELAAVELVELELAAVELVELELAAVELVVAVLHQKLGPVSHPMCRYM